MQIEIRPLQESDAYTSVIWRNDKDVFKYTSNVYDCIITIESELNWIKGAIANNEIGKDYRCAILADGLYVGNIYLTDIDEETAHYHIFIGEKKYWGKGVARAASKLILEYAFDELKLKEVLLRVNKLNTAAYSLYQNLGFVETEEIDGWISMKKIKD